MHWVLLVIGLVAGLTVSESVEGALIGALLGYAVGLAFALRKVSQDHAAVVKRRGLLRSRRFISAVAANSSPTST